MRLIVTGGAGFIGSAVIREAIRDYKILNLDCLTYAGNLESLGPVENHENYQFKQVDICDKKALESAFKEFCPDRIMHLAAESHVDRSIDGPEAFLKTNIMGTYNLLEVARDYYNSTSPSVKDFFKFHHISTDEVYGSLGEDGLFHEKTPYQPNSPYSASKASSDHLVRAWYHTFGLPVVTTNCSNNYGPYQFPEKLIPLMILNAIDGKPLPVYGKGDNIRDWLFVEDHAKALLNVLDKGKLGETYNIGGKNERTNIDVVHAVCNAVDEFCDPLSNGKPRTSLITYVTDRPGHDMRYAIDASKIENELKWKAEENFESGIIKTVKWYLENKNGWCARVQDGSYQRERLGLS